MDSTRIPKILIGRKVRALFLTFLLIASPIAMSVAFTGNVPGIESDHSGKALADSTTQWIYTGAYDDTVKRSYAENGSVDWTFSGHTSGVQTVSPSPDGEWVVSGSSDDTVKRLDATDGSEDWTFSGHSGSVYGTSQSPDSEWVYTGSQDDTVKRLDATDGSEDWTFSGHGDDVHSVSPSPDGEWIYTGSDDDTVKRLDATDGSEDWTFSGHGGDVHSLSPSPDGEWIYTGSNDATVKRLNATDGSEDWTFSGHDTAVATIGHGADGNIISVSSDQTAKKIDSETGEEIWTVNGSGIVDRHTDIAVIGDMLYFGLSDGNVAIVEDNGDSAVLAGEYSPHATGSIVTVGSVEAAAQPSPPSDSVSGQVATQDGTPVSNATVATDTSVSTTTDSNGFYNLTLTNGTYDLTASKEGYRDSTETITVEGNPVQQDFQLVSFNQSINLDTKRYIEHGQRADYRVIVTNNTGRYNVTGNASVTSGDESVVTVDTAEFQLQATTDLSVNNRTTVTAEWADADGNVYTTRTNVTVANATVENIDILPTWTKVSASLGDETLQLIIVATMVGAGAALFASSFAGLSAATGVVVLGWFAGMSSDGVLIVSFMMAIFIGLNLAGNINMQVGSSG